MRSPRSEVEKILKDMRSAWRMNKIDLIPRKKNMDTLALMGLLPSDAKDAMYGLTYSDYVKGPEEDRDDPQSDRLWVFKMKLDNQIIYIKFKILYQTDGSVKTLSFHIDET